jgi:hypothetical protein
MGGWMPAPAPAYSDTDTDTDSDTDTDMDAYADASTDALGTLRSVDRKLRGMYVDRSLATLELYATCHR